MIDFKNILNKYIERTGFAIEDIAGKSQDRRVSEKRHLLWLILRSSSPLVRYKDIVEFMGSIGHKTTVSNVQQNVKKMEMKIQVKGFRPYAKVVESVLDEI
tara:strand:+ start:214 stop:516 length:303 start_codon:yes stop_codon:yes gene_type:complete